MQRRNEGDEVIKRNADFARIVLNNNDGLSLDGVAAPVNLSAHGRRVKVHDYEPTAQIQVPSLSIDSMQEAREVKWHREELKSLSARLGLHKQKQRRDQDQQAINSDANASFDDDALVEAYLGTHFTSFHFTSLHFTSLHFTSLHFTSFRSYLIQRLTSVVLRHSKLSSVLRMSTKVTTYNVLSSHLGDASYFNRCDPGKIPILLPTTHALSYSCV